MIDRTSKQMLAPERLQQPPARDSAAELRRILDRGETPTVDQVFRMLRDRERGDAKMVVGDVFQDDPRENPKSRVTILWVGPRYFVYQRGEQLPVGAPHSAAEFWRLA